MGVPKFYRWLSERYPCLSEVVKEHQIPEFDNLYLDMNGIVHICSHPNDDDVHFRISEEKIIQDIFHYIEVLFRMIQPRKVFFMAIDGVAPRAKMNQQRGRRFRSAKDAEVNEKRAKDRGEELPKEARFDSNCITPGTSFMDRLHQQLKYFVVSKISTDTLWQGVKVVLSGHETPGEGEHKIMDFIRFERSKPDYDPDTRHCLYGLDADLVMLGMCTHDPHFSLLREEVRFGGKKTPQKRATAPEETTFHLLHLSLLREYLDHEFSSLKETLTFDYDMEGIIDDWILLGFLVGNDFIPHLPHLHINKGALSELYDTYKQELPKLGGFINCNGILNLERFEKFMIALSMREMERFDDIYSDNKWLEGKTARRKPTDDGSRMGTTSKGKFKKLVPFETVITDTPGPASVEELLLKQEPDSQAGNWQTVKPQPRKHEQQDLMRLIHSADDFLTDEVSPESDEDDPFEDECSGAGRDNQYHMEFRQHKREYYIQKLGYSQVTASVLKEQAECYVRAIQWNLHYYYNGCKSWSWYYPHHFAPWITDIKGFSSMDLTFELSKPFKPFEQLLSVLPAASKELLPQCFQNLMCQPTSPIIDYYPEDFESDLNGKQQDWEAVVLIPFIDEIRLLEAMKPYLNSLTPDEKRRNTHGPMQIFTYTSEKMGPYPSPQHFPTIELSHAKKVEVFREEWEVPQAKLRKGLLPETRLDVFFPGFPTLKHIPHTASLSQESVRVFEQMSRGFNMILTLKDQGQPSLDEIAETMLGQEIWVSWPHMVEAKVVGVKDPKRVIYLAKDGSDGGREFVRQESIEGRGKDDFYSTANTIAERYKSRWGIKIGNTQIIIQACVMTGRKYVCSQHGKITLEKQWSKIAQPFALQAVRKDILVHDPSFTQYRTLPELFPPGSTCFMLAPQNYGAQGTVVEIAPEQKGRITLSFIETKDVDLSDLMSVKDDQKLQYFPGYRAAQKLGISSHLLSRITGCVFILRGPKEADLDHASKVNIGLNLKLNKKNEEVCGFSKRGEDNNWIYSTRTIQAVNDYMSNFPEVFDYMAKSGNLSNDMFHHSDVFPNGDGEARLRELQEWMNDQPFSSASRQPCGTLALDESVVRAIEKLVDENKNESRQTILKMHVKPHLLFKPNLSKGGSMPDPDSTFQLFDRVVNVRQGFSVPLGLKGTITGILNGAKPEDVMVEVLFDSEFSGGLSIRSDSNRSYRLPGSALINLSHGNRPKSSGQRQSQGRYNNPKPVARVKPMGTPPRNPNDQIARSHPPSNDSENMISAPDPKMLPKPTGFLMDKPKGHQNRNARPQDLTHQSNQMEALWASLQQPTDPPPPPANPFQPYLQEPGDLTAQLKSILNIGGGQQYTPRQRVNLPRGPPPPYPPPVQVVNHQRPAYRPRSSAPFANQPGSYRPSNHQNQGPYPAQPGSYPRATMRPESQPNPNSAATAFIPLQVHKKHSSKGPNKSGPTNPSDGSGPSTSGGSARSPRKNIVAPEQKDRVLNWVTQTQEHTAAGASAVTKTTAKPESEKGRKKRLAANFSVE